MSDDAKTWLCRWCTFEGLTREHIVAHELDAHPKFYSARETAGCGCGPNEACSRCSAPRPGLLGHYEGCPGLEIRGPCTCAQRDAQPKPVEKSQSLEERCREEHVLSDTEAWRILGERDDRLMAAYVQSLLRRIDARGECAHQWLPHGRWAWCPNCDKVRAPPESVR